MTLAAKAAQRATADGRLLVDVTLRNPGPQVALMAHLQLRRKGSGERVLPAFYSDNYLSFAPQEERTVTIEAAMADLKGDRPLVVVDGWNIAVKAEPASAVEVALDAKAQVGQWPKTGFGFAEPKLEPAAEFHLDCGGFARDGFLGDPGYLDGSPGFTTDPVAVGVPQAAPEAIYQTVRWGACAYPFTLKPKPGQTYTVRLHFAELNEKEAGKRLTSVAVNGKAVVTDLDIFKEAGGKFRALVRQVAGVVPDADGRITVEVRKSRSGTPQINGIEILEDAATRR